MFFRKRIARQADSLWFNRSIPLLPIQLHSPNPLLQKSNRFSFANPAGCQLLHIVIVYKSIVIPFNIDISGEYLFMCRFPGEIRLQFA
ncbi:hypothetical protein D3C76_1536440 [compost metagenome]